MKNPFVHQVRQVAVTDPIATTHHYDYADAFEVHLPEPDRYSPETWVRAGFEATPKFVDRIVGLLGVPTSEDTLSVFRIIRNDAEVLHLEVSVPLMRVVIVGRRVEPTRRMLTTLLRYERPVLTRLVWSLIGIGHRWAVPRLMTAKI